MLCVLCMVVAIHLLGMSACVVYITAELELLLMFPAVIVIDVAGLL